MRPATVCAAAACCCNVTQAAVQCQQAAVQLDHLAAACVIPQLDLLLHVTDANANTCKVE